MRTCASYRTVPHFTAFLPYVSIYKVRLRYYPTLRCDTRLCRVEPSCVHTVPRYFVHEVQVDLSALRIFTFVHMRSGGRLYLFSDQGAGG